MSDRVTNPDGQLTGDDLRHMFLYAQASLNLHVATINALNVFPVPDGDTGTNMSLTLKEAEEKLRAMVKPKAREVALLMARESLMGARGNSGVILSQFFGGIAQAFDQIDTVRGEDIANALTRASDQVYKAVSEPVEGTMLTVVKEAAKAASSVVERGDTVPLKVWGAACEGAKRALAETPELLPVLKEAGVVDAGGLGVVTMLEGIHAYLKGAEVSILEMDFSKMAPGMDYLSATEDEAFGYCTQFLLEGEHLEVEEIRETITGMSSSTVVVGDANTVKVHCHAHDPGPLISYAVLVGEISQVKIENMDRQNVGFVDMHRNQRATTAPLGVVAVAAGIGLEQIFLDYGAVDVVPGGQTMNPSARELAESAERSDVDEVILLPNNSNIINSAKQAAEVSNKTIHILPTTSIPEGISALLAFNPDTDAVTNLEAMRFAADRTQSGEITRAVRSTQLEGFSIREGQAIGILNGKLVACADSAEEALKQLCVNAAPRAGTLITLYWGANTSEKVALDAAEMLGEIFSDVDLEIVIGGQPHYDYFVAIE